jgi:hypothetical protein
MRHLLKERTSRQANAVMKTASTPANRQKIAPTIVHDVLRSPGQPLNAETRAFFEPRFGQDFSHVRAHTDARAAKSADAVNALAYTVGQDIVFGAGRYMPETQAGRKLLSHELTHTVQQAGNSGQRSGTLAMTGTHSSEEQEAERTSEATDRGNSSLIAGHSPMQLARQQTADQQPDLDANAVKLGNAGDLRISTLRKAIYELRQVEIAVEEEATVDQIWSLFAPTLWSLILWLKVTHDDPAFAATIHQALAVMRSNLSLAPGFFQIPDDVSTCGADPTVLAFARSPDVFVCYRAFGDNQLCLAIALTHEIFHLVGLTHSSQLPQGGAHPCESLSTAESLTNPYCMTDLVFQISGGTFNTWTVNCP